MGEGVKGVLLLIFWSLIRFNVSFWVSVGFYYYYYYFHGKFLLAVNLLKFLHLKCYVVSCD